MWSYGAAWVVGEDEEELTTALPTLGRGHTTTYSGGGGHRQVIDRHEESDAILPSGCEAAANLARFYVALQSQIKNTNFSQTD